MNINPVNILILGRTGVGKSSLINYLLNDQTLAETSTGFPVTAKGFHLNKGVIHQLPIHVYDSWGIETGLFDEWMKSLKTFITKSNRTLDCIWFCINSNSHRIQQTELEVMNYLISKGFDVTVIFTKCSPNQMEEANELRAVIEAEIPVIHTFIYINSVEETFMSGDEVEPFGVDELLVQLAEVSVANNLERFKKSLKTTLMSLFESEDYTLEELKDYLLEVLLKDDVPIVATIESGWLPNTKKKITEKSSQLMKKVESVKKLVKRSKVEENSNEKIEMDIEQLLNEPIVEEMLSLALKKELLEGR